jgi:hypothetical protein
LLEGENVTNLEIEKMRDVMENRIFATKEELLELITEINPNRNPSYMRFYLFDLVKANVLHKYDDKRYKFNGKLKQFIYEYTDSDFIIKEELESKFEDIELCIWNTSFLSQYLNLMPFDYFTFVETNKDYLELIFDALKSNHKILFSPNQKELDLYSQRDNQLIVKKLITRAPLDNLYENNIGINSGFSKSKRVVYRPKIEKILVDIFSESNTLSIFSELHQIFYGIFKAYCINYQKLFYYAKNRGTYEELRSFLENQIHFDFKNGVLR